VSCTRRWAGDTCRFQGIRFFLKDEKQNIVGVSFVENQKADSPTMKFPTRWNRPLDTVFIKEIKLTVARALLPTLKEEQEHLRKPEIIRRPRDSDVRATCDTCMTSIFSSSWMCRLCGREACSECFAKVRELTQYRTGASDSEIAALQAKRESHAHTNPFFLSCTRRNEHQFSDFSPMSRFDKAELEGVIESMEKLLQEETVPVGSEPAAVSSNKDGTAGVPEPNTSPFVVARKSGVSTRPAVSSPPPVQTSPLNGTALNEHAAVEDPSGIPSHSTMTYTTTELTDTEFRRVWPQGAPLVVTGVGEKFGIRWRPEHFREKHGSQTCSMVECQTDASKRITVGEFFGYFGKYEGRTDHWKLKDWPSSSDFKAALPDLYEEFQKGVPMPNYSRRDGVLNIASHFPSNTVMPDLGPKMYIALATTDEEGSKGSTRLHMDMADGVNIMVYSEARPDGSPGVAAWDLFRAEDADRLRKFLKRRFGVNGQHDPILSQQYYLDAALRKELFDDYGIKSHRVYQRPGDAVFIPAGCAHQVANLADSIKVAVDFVSSKNIARCEKLTGEFREQNQSMVWKEDSLQLRTMMWFAWLSCTRQEEEIED
jgi:lysine-specific demethylase 3